MNINTPSDIHYRLNIGPLINDKDQMIKADKTFSSLNQVEQADVIMAEYREGWAARAEKEPDDEIIKSGVKPDNIRKWKVLQSLQDRNETLFYR